MAERPPETPQARRKLKRRNGDASKPDLQADFTELLGIDAEAAQVAGVRLETVADRRGRGERVADDAKHVTEGGAVALAHDHI